MAKPSKQVFEFMKKYGIDSDEIWEVHGSTWVVKHSALERVAAEQNVRFDRPAMLEHDSINGIVALVVFGKLGEREEWSIGEAHPKNNKNAYPYAMAEKRAKDRVILKLLQVHGALYSEEEADDFKRQNPHVTRAEDVTEPIDYDKHGNPIDNIPHSTTAAAVRVKDARKVYDDLEKEAWAFGESKKFIEWMNLQTTIDCVATGSPEWQAMFRGRCKEHLDAIRIQEQGDKQRYLMAGA